MRGSRYLDHSRRCLTCGNGRLCPEGRKILTSPRGEQDVTPIPVSAAGTAPKINIRSLIIGSAL